MQQPSSGGAASDGKEAARLRQFIMWTLIIAGGLIPLDLLINATFGYPSFLFHAGAIICILPILLLSLWLARRGQLRGAAIALAAGLDVGILLLVLIMPSLTAAGVLVTIVTIMVVLPYLAPREILIASIGAMAIGSVIYLLGTLLPPLVAPLPPLIAALYGALGVTLVLGLTLLSLWQYRSRLHETIAQTHEANVTLEAARASLEQTVAARTVDLSQALREVESRAAAQARLLEENAQQREALREMSVPVLPVSAGVIVIPLIGTLDSERLRALQEQALQAIERSRARYVLLDITGVPLIDTAVAGGLLAVVQSSRLLGAEIVLVGVRPEVAQTIVALGIDMGQIRTRQSLEEGIAYLARAMTPGRLT